jgi:hypothetical protein
MRDELDLTQYVEGHREMFEKLYTLNVNEYTEKKNGLTYLSWSYAWAEFKKVYPTATYEIKKFENNMPFIFDENTGYMVFTSITAGDLTYEMWLPVMDSANKAMKNVSYSYKVKEYKSGRPTGNMIDKEVEAATMFDINKTIMRCLVKNLAMFGLGLYVYSGEDLPEVIEQKIDEKNINLIKELATKYVELKGGTVEEVLKFYLIKYKVMKIEDLTYTDGIAIGKALSNGIARIGEKQ